jgi:hypothetical protein
MLVVVASIHAIKPAAEWLLPRSTPPSVAAQDGVRHQGLAIATERLGYRHRRSGARDSGALQ